MCTCERRTHYYSYKRFYFWLFGILSLSITFCSQICFASFQSFPKSKVQRKCGHNQQKLSNLYATDCVLPDSLSIKHEEKRPRLLSSYQAACTLRDQYNKRHVDKRTDDNHNLYLITSDASSHGANRNVGLASIIREINASSGHKCDKVWIEYKRQQKNHKNYASELAAIMLGIRKLLLTNREGRQCKPVVWILTDCQAAVNFFVNFEHNNKFNFLQNEENLRVQKKQKRTKVKKSTQSIVQESYRRYLSTLLQETCDLRIVKVRSSHSHEPGFLDHMLADVLSRSVIGGIKHTTTQADHDDFYMVPSLDESQDLTWLENSEKPLHDKNSNLSHHAVRKRLSGERIQINKKLLLERFRIDVF